MVRHLTRGPRPTYYIGLYTTATTTDPWWIWIQIAFDGDRTAKVPPKSLAEFYDQSASGREGEATNFMFTKEIKPPDDNAAAIGGWLIQTLRDAKQWADEIA